MNDKKKTQNAFLEAISVMIDKKIKNLGFNYYVDGVVQTRNNDNTYNVLINNILYKNVPSKNNFEYLVGDTVQVLVKNGNWNKKMIDDKVGHDKVPQNLLNLGTRIRICGNSDFNDYKTVGSYAVYSNNDAQTISNMPYQMAGVLDVYLSNGDKIYNDNSYIYLIQEYTILNGTKRYYRHISKSGNKADWIYGEWFGILTTSITQDYIVEQGTDGIWTYQKWNSGIAECWGTASFIINSFNSAGGIYYTYPSSSEKPTLPFPFYKDDSGNPPVVSASCPWNYTNWVNGFIEPLSNAETAYTKCGWLYYGANSNGSGENRNIYLRVIGKWK